MGLCQGDLDWSNEPFTMIQPITFYWACKCVLMVQFVILMHTLDSRIPNSPYEILPSPPGHRAMYGPKEPSLIWALLRASVNVRLSCIRCIDPVSDVAATSMVLCGSFTVCGRFHNSQNSKFVQNSDN